MLQTIWPTRKRLRLDRRTRAKYLGHFDFTWYLATNPDVAASRLDPLRHYLEYGWREGRRPNSDFCPVKYLAQHPDLAEAGGDPLLHAIQAGRSMPSGTSSVRPPEPAPAAAHPGPVVDAPPSTSGRDVLAVDLVHANDYLIANPDLAAGGVDPVTHWLTQGFRERRSPAPGVTVRSGLLAERAPPESGWMKMACRDENVAIRIRPLSRSVIDQIGN